MIKFVVQKPVKKIQRQYTNINSDKKTRKIGFRFFSIKLIWLVFLVFATIYGSFFLLKSTIFNSQYTIKRVQYVSGDIAWYDDPYMYKTISNRVKGENYSVVKLYLSRVLSDVQSKYPMVSDITIEYVSPNTVRAQLSFVPIDMIIRNQNLRFALIGKTILPIYSGNKIAQGIKILDLPYYMSGINVLSGLFYRQSATGLIQQIDLLYQGFPELSSGDSRIEYLPGGERSIVYVDNKRLFVNNLNDIPQQIRSYQLLKKYYKEYGSLKDIDLGSLEEDKIIVKK